MPKSISDLKIGYSPYSENFSAAGDRRRFVFYAGECSINFEFADSSKEYDLIYITTSSNISEWVNYKKRHKNVKLIFEIMDSYILDNSLILNFSRGIIRYLLSRESKLSFFYNSLYYDLFRLADAVVCSTEIQKQYILEYNNNVHISLDYFEDEITSKKDTYKRDGKLKLVWEGQSYTAMNILEIQRVLERYSQEIILKVVTDKKINYSNIIIKKTEKLFSRLNIPYEFVEWNKNTFTREISQCDIAIIPIDKSRPIMLNKPENKLLFFWQIGIPVITTDTPAYKNVFDKIGYKFYCENDTEWEQTLGLFLANKIDIYAHMTAAKKYLQEFHSKELILKNWNKILKSVI